jgi:quinol monooxygenase YgiN
MIHVIATISVAPGMRDRLLEVFKANVPAVLAEDGCLEYGAAVDTPIDHPAQAPLRPDAVVVIEKWRDAAALKAHSTAPHMQAYRTKVKDYVLSVSLQVLQPA